MGEEEPNGSFMDTWLDSPYIYDFYDTNDGDYMIVIAQVRYEGWHFIYARCHPSYLTCVITDIESPSLVS